MVKPRPVGAPVEREITTPTRGWLVVLAIAATAVLLSGALLRVGSLRGSAA